ncbi:dipeptidase [Sutcliffiella cohnii]
MNTKIFDAHSDVLYKMWLDPTISFHNSPQLHITSQQLKSSGSKIQCFAIYVPENVKIHAFEVAIQMIDIFYEKIINKTPNLKLIRTKEDINHLKEEEIGAILTLEGCESIGSSIERLRALYRLGVSSVGLTWNFANEVADGVLERRGAGLTNFGREVVLENNKHNIWTDVSHLSEKGFWEVMELGNRVIASHSNVKELCNHPRNLTDDQIKMLVEKDGVIGITFVPPFLVENGNATVFDIIKHVDHVCALGGEDHVGFGSDFDGITETVQGLSTFSEYENLINILLNYYTDTQVQKFLFDNFVRKFPRN